MSSTESSGAVLPLLPLRSVTLLPGISASVDLSRQSTAMSAVRRASERRASGEQRGRLVVGVLRDNVASPSLDDLHPVGVACEVVQILPGIPGRSSVVLRGLRRVRLLDLTQDHDHLSVRVETAVDAMRTSTLAYALAGALQDLLKRHDGMLPSASRTKQRAQALAALVAERSPGLIADLGANHLDLGEDDRLAVLLETDVSDRLRKVLELASHRINVLQVKQDLDRYVREHLSKHEHDAVLRHKLRAIQSELGEGEGDAEERGLQELGDRLDALDLPDEAAAAASRELARLRRMHPQSGEATISRTYLEWIADLPWGDAAASPDKLNLPAARALLEAQHHGLEKVKKRILEYLSVRKLAPDKRGPILCLVGPPGVGKTSLGRSIAEALGRQYVRISLGGLRDDAEIRGHRRTYIGALPGRFIQALKRAGTVNPVIVLDEIDKLVSASLRGDPASALLEALDPEVNATFRDHYLDVDVDLSRVIFLCTANDLSTIPAVLRDRLEVIQISGYTLEEKLAIARQFLLPKQQTENGLDSTQVEISDEVLRSLATQYTRESGVRNLERQLAALLRDIAMHLAEGSPLRQHIDLDEALRILGPPRDYDELAAKQPSHGGVTGLGWTAVCGTLLFVEASIGPGTGEIRMTGKLGAVMKESAQAAISLVRSHHAEFGVPEAVIQSLLKDHDLHLHFPAGAVPKDGPSAGVAITTALISLFTGRPARTDIAMTGEITLRGQVLPVGGIREKVLAAHRAGIREVILPHRNRKDEPEIPSAARVDMQLTFVHHIREVIDLVLLPAPGDEQAAAE